MLSKGLKPCNGRGLAVDLDLPDLMVMALFRCHWGTVPHASS